MRKILFLLIMAIGFIFSTNVNAQKRVKMGDGIYLVCYGQSYVIENDKKQQSINLYVYKSQKSTGEIVYDVMCGNKAVKGIAKMALSKTISSVLTASGAAAWVAPIASSVASSIYDEVCDYYKNK